MKIFCFFLILIATKSEEKVELIIHLFRHGARLSDKHINIKPYGFENLEKMGLTSVGLK